MHLPLFDMVPDALIVVDEVGRIVLANHQAGQLFGYAPGELAGLSVEQLMPEGVRGRHHAHRAGYMASPRIRPMGSSGMALVGQRKDGEQFPVEIALSPLETDEGLRYLASIRDISETQRARQALVRARYDALVARIGQQALESSGEDHIVASLPTQLIEALGIEGVAIVFFRDHGGLEVRASIGFEGAGFDAVNLRQGGQSLLSGQLLVIDDLDREPHHLFGDRKGSGAVVPLQGRGRPIGTFVAWSHEPRRFDHDAMHLLQSAANVLAALIQRRSSEEQLAHAQRLDAVGQLTGGIAHDFNNLLTVMSGSLQLLELQGDQKPEAAELIASALRSVGRGAELTSKLLAFARRQQLNPSAIVPARQLRDLELMLRRTLGDPIRLKVECPEHVPAAYADASQLDTALLNLALNARDAMPRGGNITISAEERWVDAEGTKADLRPGHYIVFSVADTGLGMTAETLARAVEPFYTTKGPGRGSGLGLSMVYGFVEQSGGHFRIDSRLGYGTRIELYLPTAEASATDAATRTADISPGDGELVLVVEDEAAVRNIASAFLRSLGYRVKAVGSAEQALESIDSDPAIALLFSDVMLGTGMNGKELAIAARSRRPELAVLLASGYDDTTVPDGVDFELLRKPYLRDQLAAALRSSLQNRPGFSSEPDAA